MIRLPDNAWNPIVYLRKEAANLKACFMLGFVTAAIVIIGPWHHWLTPLDRSYAHRGGDRDPRGRVAQSVKYGTSNRYHGYGLHLERS